MDGIIQQVGAPDQLTAVIPMTEEMAATVRKILAEYLAETARNRNTTTIRKAADIIERAFGLGDAPPPLDVILHVGEQLLGTPAEKAGEEMRSTVQRIQAERGR